MPVRTSAKVVAVAAAVSVTAFLVGAGAPSASATTAEHLTLSWSAPNSSVFTLPTTDGFDDTISANLTSNKNGTVEVTYKRLSGHGGAAFDEITSFPLDTKASGFGAQAGFSDTGLTVGSWQVTFKLNGESKTATVKIGSGVATSVKVTTSPAKVFVGQDAAPHEMTPNLVAKDELGTSLPLTEGLVKYADARLGDGVEEGITPSASGTAGATAPAIDVEPFDPSGASIKVFDIQGPVTSTHTPSATIHPTLSKVKLDTIAIDPFYTTLYPNSTEAADGISVTVKDNAGVTVPLDNSTMTITKGSTVVATWPISDTSGIDESWNGLDGSNVIAGTYKLIVFAALQGGNTLTKTVDLKVSTAVPIQKTVTESYPGSDFSKKDQIGNDSCKSSGSALDCVSGAADNDDAYIEKSVPSSVLALARQLGYDVTGAIHVSGYSASGGVAGYEWGDPTSTYGATTQISEDGTATQGPLVALSTATKVRLDLLVRHAISLNVTKFTVTYEYWAAP